MKFNLKIVYFLLFLPLMLQSQSHIKETLGIKHDKYSSEVSVSFYSYKEYIGGQITQSYSYSDRYLLITNYIYPSRDTTIEVRYRLRSKNDVDYSVKTRFDSNSNSNFIEYVPDIYDETGNIPCLTLIHKEPLLFNINTILICKFDTVKADTTRTIYNSFHSIICKQTWKNNHFKTYKTYSYNGDNNMLQCSDWEYTINKKYLNGREINSSFSTVYSSDTLYSIALYTDSNRLISCRLNNNDTLLSTEKYFKGSILRKYYNLSESKISWKDHYFDSIPYNSIPNKSLEQYGAKGEIIKKEKWVNGVIIDTWRWEYTNIQNDAISYIKKYKNDILVSTVITRKY